LRIWVEDGDWPFETVQRLDDGLQQVCQLSQVPPRQDDGDGQGGGEQPSRIGALLLEVQQNVQSSFLEAPSTPLLQFRVSYKTTEVIGLQDKTTGRYHCERDHAVLKQVDTKEEARAFCCLDVLSVAHLLPCRLSACKTWPKKWNPK